MCVSYIIESHCFIHSPADRHLGCLHISAIVNDAAMNMVVQISLQDTNLIFFRYIYPEERLLDHMVVLFLILWGTSILISGGFPGGAGGKDPTCQCRRRKRLGFNPWVGKIPWRRKWQPTPVCLPGESHGQRSLAGYSPWGRKESDTTWPLSTCWPPYWLHQCTFPPTVNKGSLFSTSSSSLAISCLFYNNHFNMWGDISLWFSFAFPWQVLLSISSYIWLQLVCLLWRYFPGLLILGGLI